MATRSTRSLSRGRFAIAEVLEPRVLYSVDALGPLAPLLGDELPVETSFDLLSVQPHTSLEAWADYKDKAGIDQPEVIGNDDQDTVTQSAPRQLAFIDAGVPDVDRVVDALERSGIDAVIIEAGDDGLLVISQVLAGRDDLTAVHVISHGSSGSLTLGNAELNASSVESNAAAIIRWGDALSVDADILFYGCDFASTKEGVALVDRIAQLTAADVAASDDLTGHTSLGADWNLELATGTIETVLFGDSSFRQEWLSSLDTITVTRTDDPAFNPFGDISDLDPLNISLRSAISAANNTPGHYTIILGAGNYELTIPDFFGADVGNGTLDLEVDNDGATTSSLVISGAGEGLTNIIQTQDDRILLLRSGDLSLEYLTITGGEVSGSGGGIRVASGAVLNTMNVTFDDNESIGASFGGGGVGVQGTATFVDTTFVNNKADSGGGIESSGTLVLQKTTFDSNESLSGGGGLSTDDAGDSSLAATDVMFISNTAGTDGGAIELLADDVLIERVTFYDNSATGAGGAINLEGKDAVLINTTFSENHAAIGGAMYVQEDATVRNSTFYQNYDTSFVDAGAIRIASGKVTLANNVFDNNYTGDISTKVDVNGDVISAGFNIFTTFTSIDFRGGQADSDIALQPLGLTMGLESLAPSDGYVSTHAPMAGSQVINAGGSTEYTTDATGSLHDQIPDAGAHEYRPVTSVKFWIDTSGDIWRSNVDGTNIRLIESTMESSVDATRDIEVDFTNERIYWIAETGVVRSTTLDGGVPVSDVIVGLTATTGIAIDSFNNRLFVADRGTKEILSYELDTSGVSPVATAATTVTTTINEVNDIEFDAVSNILVWTEASGSGLDGRVVSRALDSSTDGDDSTNFDVYTYSGNPDGLTLDALANRIFVVDSTSSEVLLINYAGELLEGIEAVAGQRIDYDVISGQVVVSQFEPGSGVNYIDQELTIPFYEPMTSGPEALAISITNGVDLPPAMGVPVPVDVVQSGSVVIDGTKLSSTDDLNSPWQLKWEIVDFPTYGVIQVDGVDLATLPVAQQYFTQEQINDGLSVVYQHDGSTTSATDLITVRLTDGKNTTSTLQLNFNVEATPVFTSPAVFDVDENITSVGTVVTTDVDGGAPQYTLVGTVDDTLLSIDINTGALSFNVAPNFESAADTGGNNVYNVTVQADDGNGGIVTQGLSITVTNVNEFPVSAISDSDASIDSITENSVIGTSVGVSGFAQDQDAQAIVTYTLDNDGGGLFVIDGLDGVVTLNGVVDYETATSHDITIRATSTDSSFSTQDYTIAVGDVNDVAPIVTPAQTMSIAENAALNAVVGSVIATDVDTVGSLQAWTITGGNADGVFQINAATGQITVADTTNLDYEATSQYTLSVQVGDGVNTSAVETVVIDINDVNDVAPIVTPAQTMSIAENAALNAVVGSVIAADVDTVGSLQAWTITGGNADGVFQINAATGQITIADTTNLDYEATSQYTLSVKVGDGVNTSAVESVVIDINDVNDVAPIVTPAQTMSIAENVAPNAVVGSVIATDADTVGSLQAWTITGGNADGVFQINAATGQITVADTTNLDYEVTSQYTLSVQVGDGVNTSAVESVVIDINDVNDVAPIVTPAQTMSIAENAAPNAVVGSVIATDIDTVGSVQAWTITGGNADGVFQINAATGQITIADATNLDYEAISQYTLSVQVGDGVNTSAVESVVIDIIDVNDVAPIVTPAQTMSIAENVAPNAVVGSVIATDVDTVGSLQSWTITGGNADGVFQINAATGQITIADTTNLDYEATSQYTLSVQVGDGVNTSAVETVVIDIIDVNDVAPIVTPAQTMSIAENVAPNAVVGSVVATDADTVGSLQSWTITSGNADGVFQINAATGQITIADTTNLDYETTSQYTVSVQVGDGVNTSAVESVIIDINDVNDVAPIVTPAQTMSIAENATPNAVVGSVIATDVDTVGSLQSWTITGGNADGVFQINAATGQITIADTTNLDYEVTSQYTLSVQVGDGVNTSAVETVVIDINDVNDTAPIVTSAQTMSIAENVAPNAVVGSVIASDVDTVGSMQAWTITGGNADGVFQINAATGQITVADTNNLDYEVASQYTLSVQVGDGVNTSAVETVVIDINDVNDTAPIVTPAQTMSIAENVAPNAVVGSVIATDVDTVGSMQAWTITGGNADGVFQINAATGQITVADTTNLDYEATRQYKLSVQVGDGINTSVVETVVIDINDVNEVPTFTSLPLDTAAEDIAYSYSISSDDVDGDGVSITGVTLPAWLTLTDHGDGTATLSGTPMNAEVGPHSIDLQLSDGALISAQSFTLTVYNLNDVPVFTSPAVFEVDENVTSVGSVVTTDVDGGAPQYTLVGTVDDTFLGIDINTDALSFNTAPNFESAADTGGDNVYNVTVQADDGNGGIVTQELSITVTNVNEFSTSAISDSDASVDLITENSVIGTSVGVSGFAQDQDAPDTVSYTLDNDGGGLFVIDGVGGVVTLNGAVDYETATSHDITIRATSTDGSFSTQDYTIAVGDVNDVAPIVTPSQTMSIAENVAPNAVVGSVIASDVDTVGSMQAWTITGGNADGVFQINAATGQITVADTTNLDYEVTSQYSLSVQVRDGVNTSAVEIVVIDINDVNEVPTFTSLPLVTATEDIAYSYSITSDDVDRDGVSITGAALPVWLTLTDHGDGTATLSGTPTNAEVGPHRIDLQLSDGALISTQSFTLNVNNVNDAPHSLVLDNATVAENSSDVRVGMLSSIDDDLGEIVTYFVDDSRFEIRGNELFLGQVSELDFESEALVPLQITALDLAGASATQTFNISVSDQNDAPVLINEPDVPTIAAGEAYQIPASTFGDVDGDALSYTALQSSGEALPDWLDFRESTAEFVLVDAAVASEALLIELTADDGRGGLASVSIELRFEPVIAAAEPTIVPTSDILTVIEIPTNVTREPEKILEVSEGSVPEEIPEDLFPDESVTDMLIEEVDLASLIKPAIRAEVITVNVAEDAVARLLNTRTDSQTEDDVDSIDLNLLFSEPGQTISRDYSDLVDTLDKKREEMVEEARFAQTLVGSSIGVTSGLSVGYLIWLIRGGTLMGSMLSSLPAWRLVDPLPVLGSLGGAGAGDDESLESMVDDTSMSEYSDPPPDTEVDANNQPED